jgi:hypothetical protein
MVASTMTTSWQDSQRDVALQDVANNVASTIQQLYLTLNRDEILDCDVKQISTFPVTVMSYPYTIVATLSSPADPGAVRILTIMLTLDDVGNNASASAVLGPNVQWVDSTLRSTSVNSYIDVAKNAGTLTFSFGS